MEPPDAILDAIILIALADKKVERDEVMRLRWLAKRFGYPSLTEMAARERIASVRGRGLNLDAYLPTLVPKLDRLTRIRLLQAAYMIACADGRVVASEDRMLQSIARALEIDPASYGSLLNNFMIAREVD